MVTTTVYFAPFHAISDKSSIGPCGSTIADFKRAVKLQKWPYDYGDDPSFYSAGKFGGELSWGICRQDVRNSLGHGDVVVFFSVRKFKETGDSEYRLCALATVDKKVSQVDLWREQNLAIYRKYFNLLIRPLKSNYQAHEHFEPSLEGSRLHRDWLWRIADHQGLQKKDFTKIQETDRLEPGARVRDRPVVIAKNYVLFSSHSAKTHILSNPPVIAWHSKGKPTEEWAQDKFSRALRRLTLEVAREVNGPSPMQNCGEPSSWI